MPAEGRPHLCMQTLIHPNMCAIDLIFEYNTRRDHMPLPHRHGSRSGVSISRSRLVMGVVAEAAGWGFCTIGCRHIPASESDRPRCSTSESSFPTPWPSGRCIICPLSVRYSCSTVTPHLVSERGSAIFACKLQDEYHHQYLYERYDTLIHYLYGPCRQ
jgi:hypothetical protein